MLFRSFVMVLWLAWRAGLISSDSMLKSSLTKLAIAGVSFSVFLIAAAPAVTYLLSSLSRFRYESELLVLALLGGVVYGALVLLLFGKRWLSLIGKRAHEAPAASLDAFQGTSASAAGPDEI